MSPMFSGDSKKKVAVLLTCCFALFMAMLDNTVVNVALPTISHKLGAGARLVISFSGRIGTTPLLAPGAPESRMILSVPPNTRSIVSR